MLIDILFIDSWHILEQAQRDWNAYKNLLAPNALVICDDIAEGGPGSPICGMTTFFKELPGEKQIVGQLNPATSMGFMKYAV